MAVLNGTEQFSNEVKTTQVFQATHDGAGNSLPYMNRAFISFTFGGRAIEDFGLIVTIKDKIGNQVYTSFSDLTTTYDTLDGQLYWGNKMEPNKLDLVLSTDGITERELDDFREWFAPGNVKELILSEHPNRAIMARVASAPVLSVLPFEKEMDVKISGCFYHTSTTEYKGDISLSFIMDEPYWYLKNNYMPDYIDKRTLEPLNLNSNNDNKVITLEDKDMIKIMLEDGIPHQSLLSTNMFLGGNLLVTKESRVGFSNVGQAYLGKITEESSGLTINNNFQYLFYSGTAPSYPIIKFNIELEFDDNDFIKYPMISGHDKEECYIAIDEGTEREQKFIFAMPSLLVAYNKTIEIFSTIPSDESPNNIDRKNKICERIQAEVNEYYTRAWAIHSLEEGYKSTNSSGPFPYNFVKGPIINEMKNLFYCFRENLADPYTIFRNVTFTINSKTGEAIGIFSKIRTKNTENRENNYEIITQNVGDMIRSEYLVLKGRNYLNSNGEIDESCCKKISSNIELNNVLILFQNMYL